VSRPGRDPLAERCIGPGPGARHDASEAPREDLLLARRGTAYFSRKLGELTDDALNARSLRAGWSRRLLIAHVGYAARDLAQRLAGMRGPCDLVDQDGHATPLAGAAQGADLPGRALRSLIHHTAIHLDVEWRDLGAAEWDRVLSLPDGTAVTARQTPFLRAELVWHAAIDLGNGGRLLDVPPALRG